MNPISPRIAFKGLLHVAYNVKRQKMIARSWPTGNGGMTPRRLLAIEKFKQMVQAAKFARPEEVAEARRVSEGTAFTWRDVVQMAASGRFYWFVESGGKITMGWPMAFQTIQVLLDSIYNVPGSMLVRAPEGWVVLLPAAGDKVLRFDPDVGIPQWGDAPADIQSLLDGISSTPNDLLIRGAAEWESVPFPTIDGIQTLLDQISSTRGTVLYRGAAGWSALAPATAGFFLKTNGAGSDPAWATAAGAGYLAGNVPTVVQTAFTVAGGNSVTFGAAPANGNLVVAMCFNPSSGAQASGWTKIGSNSSGTDFGFTAYKVMGASEPAAQTITSGVGATGLIMAWEIHGANASVPLAWAGSQGEQSDFFSTPVLMPCTKDALALSCVSMVTGTTISGGYNAGLVDVLDNSGSRKCYAGHADLSVQPVAGAYVVASASAFTKAATAIVRS